MKLIFNKPLEEGQYYVLDGGFSTQLSKYVSGVDDDPLWTARSLVNNKSEVVKVHRDFLAAGARIVLTSSYQVSCQLFQEYLGLNKTQTHEHLVDSVKLAWKAVQEEGGISGYHLVGGSVGPYGACLHDGSEYTGDYLKGEDAIGHNQLVEWHRDRIQSLQDGGVSFIAVETIPVSTEALAIMDSVMETGLLSIWISFSLKDAKHLAGGETIKDAVKNIMKHSLSRNGRVIAVGFNCIAPEFVTEALQEARSVWATIPFVLYPNSGEEWKCGSWEWSRDKKDWLEMIPAWVKLGTIILGGCCRVDAEILPKLRKQIIKGIAGS